MSGGKASDIIVTPIGGATWRGVLDFHGKRFDCALGKDGVTTQKREGDHKTPVGRFALRELLFRPDRFGAAPATKLAARALTQSDGWCDDPADPFYNRAVALPYPASAERLWREDTVYDLIIPLGYNDNPPVAPLGSAIFIHIARPDFAGTEGCVALARADLIDLLRDIGPATLLEVRNYPD